VLLCYTDSMQEQDPNIMPRISLVSGVGEWIAQHLSFLPSQSEICLTEHNRGAEAMLSEHLDDLEPAFNTSGR